METRTIPEEQWFEFFNRLSQECTGWPTTIEVLLQQQQQGRPRHVAEALPLEGISFDTKGSRPCSLEIAVGDRVDRHISHVVDLPLYVRQTEQPSGSMDVEIEPAKGPITILHLRGPIH